MFWTQQPCQYWQQHSVNELSGIWQLMTTLRLLQQHLTFTSLQSIVCSSVSRPEEWLMIDQEAEDLESLPRGKIARSFAIIRETVSWQPHKLPNAPFDVTRLQSAVTQCVADFVHETCRTAVRLECQSSLADTVWHAYSGPETTPTGTGGSGVYTVVFTDVSRFCVSNADGCVRVWRRRGERFQDNCVMELDLNKHLRFFCCSVYISSLFIYLFYLFIVQFQQRTSRQLQKNKNKI